MPTERFVPSTGSAPMISSSRPKGDAITEALPQRSETNPIRIGELMSPNMWIKKMLTE